MLRIVARAVYMNLLVAQGIYSCLNSIQGLVVAQVIVARTLYKVLLVDQGIVARALYTFTSCSG